jgi:hypothetical protein
MSGSPYTFFRINIDKSWTSIDFADLFVALEFLHTVYALPYTSAAEIERINHLCHLETWWNDQKVLNTFPAGFLSDVFLSSFVERKIPFKVEKISFASPGFADLAGIGTVVKEIRLFIIEIIDRVSAREDREIARDSAKQDVIEKRIKNARDLVELANKVGINEPTKQILVSAILEVDQFIEAKVVRGQITSVEHWGGSD